MSTCLVTKLNAAITADLPIFNTIILKLNIPEGATHRITIEPVQGETINLSVVGEGYISLFGTSLQQKIIPVTKESAIVCSEGTYNLNIENKYAIKNININLDDSSSERVITDMSEFAYSLNVNQLLLRGQLSNADTKYLSKLVNLTRLYFNMLLTGDISNLKNCTALENFVAINSSITGDIVHLGNCPLKTLSIYNTKVNGSWESFIQKQRENGRLSWEDFKIQGVSEMKVTLGGSVPGGVASNSYLYWTENTITLYGDSIANINDPSKACHIYAQGATQQQIQQWQANNNTVHVF